MGLFKKRKDEKHNVEEVNSALGVEKPSQDLRTNQQMLRLQEVANSTSTMSNPKQMEQKKLNYKNKSDCLEYVSEQCEMIAMAEKQLMEIKFEYGAVTSYLTDIQKIDQIPLENKDRLMDAARHIMNLTQERNRFQKREVKISDVMYKHFERYEDSIPSEIVKMQKNEEYENLIKEDLRKLESEKAVLDYEREELQSKKSYIRCIAVIASVLIAVLFALFGLFQSKLEADVTIPLLLTVMVGIIAVFLIFIENNRTQDALKFNERKLNKAIGLTNKVKIKYVNNRNTLDYTYQKYRVHAAKEFAYLWEQYVKMKDEMRRYQQNTELLEYYRKILIEELEEFKIDDTEVWLYQPLALVDGKEMVEVRHRLNTRRQKLREQIDYNNTIIRDSKAEIEKVTKQLPELEYQVEKIKAEYEIS